MLDWCAQRPRCQSIARGAGALSVRLSIWLIHSDANVIATATVFARMLSLRLFLSMEYSQIATTKARPRRFRSIFCCGWRRRRWFTFLICRRNRKNNCRCRWISSIHRDYRLKENIGNWDEEFVRFLSTERACRTTSRTWFGLPAPETT